MRIKFIWKCIMNTVHSCMFLTFICIGIVKCGDAQHEDRITTGIDNKSCFTAGIDNPCQSFNYVLLNSNNSCDDNCVIILLDSQPRVVNSKTNIVFRMNQSLHVSGFNMHMINVSFDSIQISSCNSSSMTFENLLLTFRVYHFLHANKSSLENL